MSDTTILNLIVYLAGVAAVYGGIRADLKHIHEKIADQHAAILRLTERFDTHITNSQH